MNATLKLCKSQDWAILAAVENAASIGTRIRELREKAGVQSQELASSLGIDPSAMSNIERGKRALKSSELAAIASILGVSPLAILSGDSLLSKLPVAARGTEAERSSGSALARLTALAELHQLLSDSDEDLGTKPWLDEVPTASLDDWRESGDELARWARQYVLPPTDTAPLDRFTELAEAIERNLAVDVMVEEFPELEVLGASITDRRFPFILVNRNQPTSRALFTLAHELGHVLSGDGGEAITLDVSLTLHTKPEMFANAFAASFLMPLSSVQEEIDKYGVTSKALARMVTRFGVSFESLVYRLHNLEHISATTRNRLQSQGWPAVLSDLGPEDRRRALGRQGMRPERRPPGILTVRTVGGYQAGVVSVRPLAGLLGLDPDVLLESYVRERDSQDVWDSGESEGGSQATSDEDRYSGVPA
jgi:Zn-dependent peptidase ImmA (M78 family)/DNA-binding XRE family transcriptional regulator